MCWGTDDVGQARIHRARRARAHGAHRPQTATEDSEFSFEVPATTFTDTDTLTWSATLADGKDLPAWLRFDPTSLAFTGTPGDADVGDLPLLVVATDTTGLTGHTAFTLTVANTNDPPQAATPIPDQDAVEDTPGPTCCPRTPSPTRTSTAVTR